jgi:hypothetical protein
MTAICAFAMPVLRYTFGIMKWTKGELKKLDIKTRKLLTMNGHHHPKASTHRLYLHRSRGGRGLTGCEDTHNCECTALAQYVLGSTDDLTQVVRETTTPTQKFLLKFASLPKYTSSETVVNTHHNGLCNKPLHGKFFVQQADIPQVDLTLSHQWLQRAHLRAETEAAICAAQEQALATNYIRKNIFKQDVNPICRLCCKENETISHIVSGCEALAGTKYTERHNQICKYLHWCMMQDNRLPVNPNWHAHKPSPAICMTDKITLMYDMTQEVDGAAGGNRPDIVLLDEKNKYALLIDVTIPMDINMVKAAAGKYKKYRDLEISMKKQYDLQKVHTIPIVVGALGTICTGLEKNLARVSPLANTDIIQKQVLLGTAHIMRHVLTDTSTV